MTWLSSDSAVAAISNADGSRGLTVVAAVLVALQVTPPVTTVGAGLSQPFVALGTFSDGSAQGLTTQVTWRSSVEAVAQVSNAAGAQGVATTIAGGTTTISATRDGVLGSATLNVNDELITAIRVVPQTSSVRVGGTLQYRAIGMLGGVFTVDVTTLVTWVSADPAVAQISNAAGSQGRATGVAPGTTAISAAFGFTTGSTTLEVAAATCGPGLVISQVYGAGGNTGSVFRSDYIELHDAGSTPADLTGLAVQYASANGSACGPAPRRRVQRHRRQRG